MSPRQEKLHKIHRFTAGYDSDCPRCFERIEAGDWIGYVDDELSCTECCNDAERENEEAT